MSIGSFPHRTGGGKSDWSVSVLFAAPGVLSVTLLYRVANWGIRALTEKTWTDLDDILAGLVVYTFSIAAALAALAYAIAHLPPYFTSLVQTGWSWMTERLI